MTSRDLSASYDDIAERWQAKLEYLWFDQAYGDLAQALDVPPNACILDVGCGTGCLSAAVLRVHATAVRITLLDPSEQMLAHAGRRLRQMQPAVIERSGRLGDDAGGPFDLVLCAHVVEHLPDLRQALENLRAELRPGGTLALVVSKPHWCSSLVWLRWRHRTFRPDTVVAALQHAGFSNIELHPMGKGPPGRVSMGYIAQA